MHTDTIITNLASSQLGLTSRHDLLDHGITARSIERRLDNGRLTAVHRGVYLVGGAPLTWEGECLAACLALGSDAAVSHRAGARLQGVRLRCDTPVEAVVPRPRVPRLTGVRVHRSVDLTDDHVESVGPHRVTTPHRLLVDLGGVVPWWLVSDALEQLIAARRVTPGSVSAFLESVSARGRNGCGVLRQVLDARALGGDVSDSALEEHAARLWRDWNLPEPVFQYAIELDGVWRRLDFAYPELKIAIEVDGYVVHSQREVFETDRARANELEIRGWLVLRFTWRQVTQRPERVAATIRNAIRLRTSHLPTSQIGA